MVKIAIEHVSKVFGPKPESVIPMIRDGVGKAEILEKTGHVVGIRDVSLQIEPGETFVVMGLSGSGKSTLIRHINRLIEPTAGRILVDGDDVLQLDEARLLDLRRNKISMVFQRFGLLPHRSVIDNVAYGLVVAGEPKEKAREKAQQQIDLVGLSGFEDRYPRQLSGGMQQRVGLARALAADPEILLMDEAFSALDPLIRNEMQAQLKELQKTLHKTIVFITHDLDEALRLGDHIAILKDGELRQVGASSDILLNPADDYVERFVRDVNRARAITIGSIAAETETLPPSEASRDALLNALERRPAVVFANGAVGEHRVVTRDFVLRNSDKDEDWWRNPKNFPAPGSLAPETTVEECLESLSRAGDSLLVHGAAGAAPRIVTVQTLLATLARGRN